MPMKVQTPKPSHMSPLGAMSQMSTGEPGGSHSVTYSSLISWSWSPWDASVFDVIPGGTWIDCCRVRRHQPGEGMEGQQSGGGVPGRETVCLRAWNQGTAGELQDRREGHRGVAGEESAQGVEAQDKGGREGGRGPAESKARSGLWMPWWAR